MNTATVITLTRAARYVGLGLMLTAGAVCIGSETLTGAQGFSLVFFGVAGSGLFFGSL